ncbi:mechanosensitive ion channel family protein [Krasilnikovia sp. MM14-A1004]|uniref:mechanosensitive ion channel family protein n=1 Tax=Krasilnikovia sp. MM14-A1004 TaxID=3373541 RepID=UPI00399CFDCF
MSGDDLSRGLSDMWRSVLLFVPTALAFIAILAIGYVVARLARTVVAKALQRMGFDRAVERGAVRRALRGSNIDASDLCAKIAFYAVLLFALQLAFGLWGPNPVSDLLTVLIAWLPRAFVAIVIVVVASAIAGAAHDLIASALGGLSYGRLLARIASVLIITLGVIAALDQVHIATSVTQPLLIAVLATVAGILVVGVGGGLVRPMQRRWEEWLERAGAESAAIREHARSYADERAREAAEQARREEEARQAEEARKAEEARRAEEARKAEEARQAEEARKAEEARRAEEARKAQEAREAEHARRAQEVQQAAERARRAEEARKAEEVRQVEEARKAEETRQTEQARAEQRERAADEARRAEQARLAAAAAVRAEAEAEAARQRERRAAAAGQTRSGTGRRSGGRADAEDDRPDFVPGFGRDDDETTTDIAAVRGAGQGGLAPPGGADPGPPAGDTQPIPVAGGTPPADDTQPIPVPAGTATESDVTEPVPVGEPDAADDTQVLPAAPADAPERPPGTPRRNRPRKRT